MTLALVLGSAGFLGRHVTAAASAAGWQVRCAPPQEQVDLTTLAPQGWDELLTGVDVVVNAAGVVSGDEGRLTSGNVHLVRAVVQACRRAAGPGPRLIHLGSLAEYGLGDGHPWREDDPAVPVSPYGRTKAEGTALVTAAVAAGDLDAVVLRLANPVGAGQPPNSLLGSVAAQLAGVFAGGRDCPEDAEIRVGPLGAHRDFVAATDVAAAVLLVGSVPQLHPVGSADAAGAVLNIGSGQATSTRDAVQILLRRSGFHGRLVEDERRGSSRSADSDISVADISRARRLYGWRPTSSLEQTLDSLIPAEVAA